MRSKYLYIRENFTSISLSNSDDEIIKDYLPDIESNIRHQCFCIKCQKPLTENQYKKNELEWTDNIDPMYLLQHKKCK